MDLDFKILKMLAFKFIANKNLSDEFSAFATDFLLDELRMKSEDVKAFIERLK